MMEWTNGKWEIIITEKEKSGSLFCVLHLRQKLGVTLITEKMRKPYQRTFIYGYNKETMSEWEGWNQK